MLYKYGLNAIAQRIEKEQSGAPAQPAIETTVFSDWESLEYVNGPDTLSRSFVEAVDMRCTGFECARKRGMSNNEDGDGHDADN